MAGAAMGARFLRRDARSGFMFKKAAILMLVYMLIFLLLAGGQWGGLL